MKCALPLILVCTLLCCCGAPEEPREETAKLAADERPPEAEPEPAVLPPLADQLPTGGTDTIAVRDAGAPPVPRIRTGSIRLGGPRISREVVRRIVRRHQAEVDDCLAAARSTNPELTGAVKIKFIVDADGAVQNAAVARNTTGAPTLGDCLAAALRGCSFPQPEGGGIEILDYEFPVP